MSYFAIDPLLRAALEPDTSRVREEIALQALRLNDRLLAERTKPRAPKRKSA